MTPFSKWPPRNWQNQFFAHNSASGVDRNEISVSTPIFVRVRNWIKALTNFYDFYLTHDELLVWRHFQNGRYGNWQNHVFAYNLASIGDRNEISVSTPIFLRVRSSVNTLTCFYDFYLTHSSKLLPLKYIEITGEITTFTIFHQVHVRYVGDCLHTSNIHCNFLYISYYNIYYYNICCQIQNKCQHCLLSFLSLQIACKQNHVFFLTNSFDPWFTLNST